MNRTVPGLYGPDDFADGEGCRALNIIAGQAADVALLCSLALDSLSDASESDWGGVVPDMRFSVSDAASRLLFKSWRDTQEVISNM